MDRNEEKQPPKEWADFPDRRAATDKILIAVNTGAAFTEVFLKTSAGIDEPGMRGALAFVALFMWATYCHSPSCLLFWQVWIAAVVVYRLSRDKTAQTHSNYHGRVRVLWRYFGDRTAAALQAVLVAGAGYLLCHVDPPLGLVILVSGACLGLNEILTRLMIRRLRIGAGNARWEAAQHASIFNERR